MGAAGGEWGAGVLGTGDYFILLPRILWCVVRGVSFARAFPPREANMLLIILRGSLTD